MLQEVVSHALLTMHWRQMSPFAALHCVHCYMITTNLTKSARDRSKYDILMASEV